jgi:hypothetical protein
MADKRLEIAAHLGRWEVVHNGVALCDCDTAADAAKAAGAIARTQPPGDRVIISLDSPDASAAAAAARPAAGRWVSTNGRILARPCDASDR